MAFAVLVLLLALPIAELWLLIELGARIGAGWTIVYLILSALLGVALLRRQGLFAMRRAMQAAAEGRPPVAETIESAGLMLAAMLLIVPGMITDAVGLLLFVPPLRRRLAAALLARAEARTGASFPAGDEAHGRGPARAPGAGAGPGSAADGTMPGPIIEGEFERIDERTVRPGSDEPEAGTADTARPRDTSQRPNGSASPWAH